jgi:putative membrane protein
MHRGFFGGPYDGGATWQHGLFLLLIVIAIVAGVVLLARMWSQQHPRHGHVGPPPPSNAALSELDLRYARGEVGREEYLQRRADLLGQVAPPPGGPGAPPASPPPAAS